MLIPRIFIGLVFSTLSLSTLAASTAPINIDKHNCPPMEHSRHEPPPSAFDDCKGKTEGTAIQHTTPSGEKVPAICVSSPKGLFARPEHPPRPEMNQGNS
jgi:hypothetical protein